MSRLAVATFAACIVLGLFGPAGRAEAQATEPFQVVPIEARARRSHTWAYLSLAGGAGLVGISFAFARRADQAYAEYLASTDPGSLDVLYDRAVRSDQLSHSSLLTGEALIAFGLYLRFIRRPATDRLSLSLLPSRCSVSFRF